MAKSLPGMQAFLVLVACIGVTFASRADSSSMHEKPLSGAQMIQISDHSDIKGKGKAKGADIVQLAEAIRDCQDQFDKEKKYNYDYFEMTAEQIAATPKPVPDADCVNLKDTLQEFIGGMELSF